MAQFKITMELTAPKEKFVLYKGDYAEKISNVYVRKSAFAKPDGPYPQFITVTLDVNEVVS
jgi:hypothetical protein